MTTMDDNKQASERVEAVRQRRTAAYDVIHSLNHAERRWVLSVPAQPTEDPDLVITASLRDVDFLLATVERQEAEIGRCKGYQWSSDPAEVGHETRISLLRKQVTRLTEWCAELEGTIAERDARIEEVERRLKIPFGRLPCAQCGGPHDFDTSIPNTAWNSVIRAKGLPEYLCTTCIVREFVRAGQGFTATLWNEEFNGPTIEVVINGQHALDATMVSEENTEMRAKIAQYEAFENHVIDQLDSAATAMKSAILEKVREMIRELEPVMEAEKKGGFIGTSYEIGALHDAIVEIEKTEIGQK